MPDPKSSSSSSWPLNDFSLFSSVKRARSIFFLFLSFLSSFSFYLTLGEHVRQTFYPINVLALSDKLSFFLLFCSRKGERERERAALLWLLRTEQSVFFLSFSFLSLTNETRNNYMHWCDQGEGTNIGKRKRERIDSSFVVVDDVEFMLTTSSCFDWRKDLVFLRLYAQRSSLLFLFSSSSLLLSKLNI